VQAYRLTQGDLGGFPVSGLKFQRAVEAATERNSPRRADALRLGQGGADRLLDFFVALITIQVILPQSKMNVERLGHVQARTCKRSALGLKAEAVLPLAQGMTGQGQHLKRSCNAG
jgi:hypothetical protein